MSEVFYEVWFLDGDGNPEEWAARSTDYQNALHYLSVFSQDGRVGLLRVEKQLLNKMGDFDV